MESKKRISILSTLSFFSTNVTVYFSDEIRFSNGCTINQRKSQISLSCKLNIHFKNYEFYPWTVREHRSEKTFNMFEQQNTRAKNALQRHNANHTSVTVVAAPNSVGFSVLHKHTFLCVRFILYIKLRLSYALTLTQLFFFRDIIKSS